MHRYLLILLLLATVGWAQDNAPEDEAESVYSPETVEDDASGDEDDDLDLDEESYIDADEEDFIPTEDIPADQAIPFPTDI